MKVTFNKETLLQAIIPAAAIAPGRNTLPSIEGIFFECPGEEDGTCRITAYDMEKGMRTSIPCKISEKGKFVINSQIILQIVRALPDGDIVIDIDEKNRATISGGSSSFKNISSMSGEKYPALPLLSGDRNYMIKQKQLRYLVNKTIFAVSTADQRAVFSGLYFDIKEGRIKVVGCDGNRLATAYVDAPEGSPDASFIVPGRVMNELMRMVKDSEEELKISVARRHVIFTIGDYVYFSHMIDGDYPNYSRIIPEESDIKVYISSAEFRGAIERASLITEDKLGGNSRTYVKLTFEEDMLKISSASAGGSIYEEVPVSIDGQNLVIGFNCRYIFDALRSIDKDVTLKLGLSSNPLEGMVVEVADGGEGEKDAEDNYLFLIMPVNMH
jgi:DNA polymerase-3 subunit beta